MTIARLQLAVGPAASLIEELAPVGELRFFSARAPDESLEAPPSRLVVIHPPLTIGTSAGALLERMASIRATANMGVAAPLATGEFEDSGWIVEPVVPPMTVARQVAKRGGLTNTEAITVFRDVSRALLALHRRGVSHGALSTEAISLAEDRITLHQLGRSIHHDPQADWRSLGRVLQATGVMTKGGRHPFPTELKTLINQLADPELSAAPISGDAVLAALDRFPTGSAQAAGLIAGSGAGVRRPQDWRLLLAMAAAGLILLVFFLALRR